MTTRSFLIFLSALFFSFKSIAQPRYRLQTLKFEVATQEYPAFDLRKRCTYTYNSDKSSIIGFEDMTPALNYKAPVQGLNYDYALVEEKGMYGGMQKLCEMAQDFDANGRIAVHKSGASIGTPNAVDTLQYDAAGRMVRQYQQRFNNLNKLNRFYFNTSGSPDSATSYWSMLNKYYSADHYYYNTSGLLVKHALMYNNPNYDTTFVEERYAYDANNRVSAITYMQNTIATPFDTVKTITIEYNVTGNIEKQTMLRWDLNSSRPFFSTIDFYTYDAKNRLQNILSFSGDTNLHIIDTSSLIIYTYNSFDLPESVEIRTWSKDIRPQFGIFDSVNKVRNWQKTTAQYELFWPTGIAKASVQSSVLSIYPIPSSGIVNVSVKFNQPLASVLYVTDMQGRRLMSRNMPVADGYTHSIQQGALPAGAYTMHVEAGGEKIAQNFVLQ